MAERTTDCSAPGVSAGIAEYGRKTRPEMIARFREHFQHQLAEAQRALAVPDDQLVVSTGRGSFAKNRQEVTE